MKNRSNYRHTDVFVESEFSRAKRQRKRTKFFVDISSAIILVGFMLIIAFLKTQVS